MLIIKATAPDGRVKYYAAPSRPLRKTTWRCRATLPGWTVETVGERHCWMRLD